MSRPDSALAVTPLDVTTPDGARLAGLWIEPPAPRSVVVLHGATAVPRDYYRRFATWLAEDTDAAVLIYSYRDCEASADKPLRASRATMGDWAVIDQAAMLDAALARHPDLPLDVIGHSLGAMGLPFHASALRVRKLVAVASGPAHFRRHPIGYTPLVLLFWFGIGPLATALAGYTPGKLIGLGGDLPAGAFWQWRRWCTSDGFHRADWGKAMPMPDLERFRGAVRTVAFTDDPMIPPPVVRDLAAFYPAATIEHVVLGPADAGGKAIGHVRAFSPASRRLWAHLKP